MLIDSKWIPTLLTVYGWPQSSFIFQDKSSADKKENVEKKYWYPFGNVTTETLQQDADLYAHHFPNSNGARRVCFFVAKEPHPGIVLLLSFSAWDQVNAVILGDATHSVQTMIQLANFIKNVYKEANIRLQKLDKQNSDLVLSACICQWFRQAHLDMQVDASAIYQEYLQQCQKMFLDRLAQYREHSPELYSTVNTSLQVLVKYQQLFATRMPITRLSQLNSADDVDKIQQLDQYQKKIDLFSRAITRKMCVTFVINRHSVLISVRRHNIS